MVDPDFLTEGRQQKVPETFHRLTREFGGAHPQNFSGRVLRKKIADISVPILENLVLRQCVHDIPPSYLGDEIIVKKIFFLG